MHKREQPTSIAQPIDYKRLTTLVKQASAEAPNTTDVEKRDEQEAALLADFIHERISLAEYHARDTHGGTLKPGEVEIPSLRALYNCLIFCGCSPEEAEELTQHEGDHLREARALGFAESKLILRFFKAADGEESLRPAISLVLPSSGDEVQIRRNLKTIIEAPDELSDLDEKQLK